MTVTSFHSRLYFTAVVSSSCSQQYAILTSWLTVSCSLGQCCQQSRVVSPSILPAHYWIFPNSSVKTDYSDGLLWCDPPSFAWERGRAVCQARSAARRTTLTPMTVCPVEDPFTTHRHSLCTPHTRLPVFKPLTQHLNLPPLPEKVYNIWVFPFFPPWLQSYTANRLFYVTLRTEHLSSMRHRSTVLCVHTRNLFCCLQFRCFFLIATPCTLPPILIFLRYVTAKWTLFIPKRVSPLLIMIIDNRLLCLPTIFL